MAFVGHFFSELQKCFQLALLLLDMFLDHVRHKSYMHELIAFVRRANENAGYLISVVFSQK